MDNSTLEGLGMQSHEMSAYWQNKTIREVLEKADPTNGYTKAEMSLDIDKMQFIVDNSTDAEKKDIARVVKRVLKFIKTEAKD